MLSLPYNIVLGSQSPRRKEILTMAGMEYRTMDIGYEEVIPGDHHDINEIPVFLAQQKALHARGLSADDLLITADTLVFLDDKVIGKPKDLADAMDILSQLSGKMHRVITGVCLKYGDETTLLSDVTKVYFKALEWIEIEHYVENYPVLDKAGAYGVQDWMGLIGIEKIEGSYFNVMGFPIHKVYAALEEIENKKR